MARFMAMLIAQTITVVGCVQHEVNRASANRRVGQIEINHDRPAALRIERLSKVQSKLLFTVSEIGATGKRQRCRRSLPRLSNNNLISNDDVYALIGSRWHTGRIDELEDLAS